MIFAKLLIRWVVLLTLPIYSFSLASAEKHPILVLCYHDIVADKETDPNSTSDTHLTAFKNQMTWLKGEGFQTISADDFYGVKKGLSVALPAKPVLITFDDGYIGEYTYAYPILKDMGFKATFFVHTDYVGTTTSKLHISWNQLREMDQLPLFKVFPHTLTHPNLPDVPFGQLASELRDSRAAVEKNLGGSRPYFAYPYGNFNTEVLKETQRFYQMAFTLDNAADSSSMYQVDRLGAARDNEDLATFKGDVARWMSVGRE